MNRTCTRGNTSANRDTIMCGFIVQKHKKVEILEKMDINPCPFMDMFFFSMSNVFGPSVHVHKWTCLCQKKKLWPKQSKIHRKTYGTRVEIETLKIDETGVLSILIRPKHCCNSFPEHLEIARESHKDRFFVNRPRSVSHSMLQRVVVGTASGKS